MAERHQATRPKARELVAPLIIVSLGAVTVAVLVFLIPGFRFIEVVALLLAVVFVAIGYKRCMLRGIMTLIFLYFATGMAASFYEVTSPYIGAPFGGDPTRGNKALAFFVLTVVIWIALEGLGRAMFRDTTLPGLRILDNLGGVFVYAIIGILVATLLFNTLGYPAKNRYAHDRAALRTQFRQVLRVHYATQSFWFAKTPPIYRYDLNPVSEEP